MGRKSFLSRLEVDAAQRAHNCQFSKKHRIEKGDTRLKVTEGRDVSHYCMSCAIKFLELDSGSIGVLLAACRTHDSSASVATVPSPASQ